MANQKKEILDDDRLNDDPVMTLKGLLDLICDLVNKGFTGILTICFHQGGLREVKKEEVLK